MTHRQLITKNNKRIVGRALRRTNYAWAKVIRSMPGPELGMDKFDSCILHFIQLISRQSIKFYLPK